MAQFFGEVMMLGKVLRVGSNNLRATSAHALGRYNMNNFRYFSEDSHDDFKPTRKNVPEGIVTLT